MEGIAVLALLAFMVGRDRREEPRKDERVPWTRSVPKRGFWATSGLVVWTIFKGLLVGMTLGALGLLFMDD